MTLSVARHFQVQDKVSSDIVRKDIGGYQTFSSIRLKDIVRCEIFAVVRHLQLSDICSCQTLSVKGLKDIVCCEIFAVIRNFQLSDTFCLETLSITKHFQLSDTFPYLTLLLRNVSGNYDGGDCCVK